jgi:hypothetical protein
MSSTYDWWSGHFAWVALDKVEELGADRAAVQSLPLGSFIAWNRLTHGRLAGKVF